MTKGLIQEKNKNDLFAAEDEKVQKMRKTYVDTTKIKYPVCDAA